MNQVLDLGLQPPANALPDPTQDLAAEPRHPLRLGLCAACRLVQILDNLPPETLFHDYPYFSSISDTVVEHARQAFHEHQATLGLGPRSFVVEIASNDGYLLRHFHEAGIPCVGFEPAANVARVACGLGIDTRVEFFSLETARRLVADRGRADLILANNVFAHVPTPNDFVAGLAALLGPRGRIVLEFPELLPFLRHLEFDTIYHEHVFYFSLLALEPLFLRHGLEVIDAVPLSIHGGSLRLHVAHRGQHAPHARVEGQRRAEAQAGLHTDAPYAAFAADVVDLRTDLIQALSRYRQEGLSIAAYGASAKGSTLLNYCGIGRHGLDLIEFVVDRNPVKQGKLTPGSHLPILPPEALVERRPAITLLLTWNFADEIMAQQRLYLEAGGRFLIPVPKVRLAPP